MEDPLQELVVGLAPDALLDLVHAPGRPGVDAGIDVPEAICESVAHMTEELDLKAIAVFTQSGSSARLSSRFMRCPRTNAISRVSPMPGSCQRETSWAR